MGGKPVTIAVIGGGFSGAVAAMKLLDRAGGTPLRVRIIEPRQNLGDGLAFSTRDPAHYLNGPAKLFSVHPQRPDHLAEWLEVRGSASPQAVSATGNAGDAFVPRSLYGEYVRGELYRAAAFAPIGTSLEHERAEAVDLRESTDGVRITLADGRVVSADLALLALGFFGARPRFAFTPGVAKSGRYIADPWTLAEAATPKAGTVLLIGGGLTALDTIVTLERKGFSGRYVSISRHGLLVNDRREPPPARDFLSEDWPTSVRALTRAVRREIGAITQAGGDWQSVVPAVRQHLAALWAQAGEGERARFNRHVRRYWELALHRGPLPSMRVLEAVRAAGRLEVRAARLEAIAEAPGRRLAVTLRPRGGAPEVIEADLVVNGTGAEYTLAKVSGRPLATSLLERGTLRPGGLGYGIDTDGDAAIVSRDGTASNRIFGIGPILRGTRWESTTIVEIVVQADAFAGLVEARHFAPRETAPTARATAAA